MLEFFCLFYCLPLSGTLFFLRAHRGLESFIFFIGSFILLSYLVRSRTAAWMSAWALGLVHLGWYVVAGSLPQGMHDSHVIGAYSVVVILIATLLVFLQSGEKKMQNKLYVTKALASAMPHEATHPLQAVYGVSYFSNKVAQSLSPIKNKAGEEGFFLSKEMGKYVSDSSSKLDYSMKQVKLEFSRFQKILDRGIEQEEQEKVSLATLIKELVPLLPEKYTNNIKVNINVVQDFDATPSGTKTYNSE